ncbi:acetyl/propionyl/methylcrotonyl-CoA carboxylase subunit alpha [Candidatus Poriferisocius sp.]|uniref:acetyl/propionyl/methylcrotonyl-CoA carboxylase subunit alpha n=1 Tax=Candidatus Poriferisocius sp. TaxID=3101276 RepID=UPI003B01E649
MLSKVLVANRGEIAVRVIRACQEMGIATVAVYSELDRNALHVRMADEAHALGGQTAAESYLNTEAILDIIERSGADGVHPGYGFFSENADFARAITARDVAFIGPNPEAIEIMGDKISARQAAERVGVSGVPGTTDLITDPAQVREFGAEHGYPVAIKAAYGGGGRGMKVVADENVVEEAIESAQREALSYFGRDEIYMERYLEKPRHVEVQVLADSQGNCVYLGTRDCSAQRRHQKLIEEAPAAGIDPDVLAAMGEAAVKVAQGCDYVNAGTVEFLYEEGEFYYLEMNTRLQVEHPATELVTGIDLVEQQIRIASGEPLPFAQEDIEISGHAIEVRINAEDPAEGAFLPSPGPITGLRAPSGYGTRWDGGYEAGDEISQFYDNLVGKLICWGRDRPTAIARTLRALDEMEVDGVATTINADVAILSHSDFAALAHSTKWVEETLDLTGVKSSPASDSPPPDTEPLVSREIDVEVNGQRYAVKMWVPEAASAPSAPASGGAKRPKRAAASKSSSSGSGDVTVPMQGTIVKVMVAVGDTVEIGDPIVVLEAMKMENNVCAEKSGTVAEIKVAEGDSVGGGDVVAVIE